MFAFFTRFLAPTRRNAPTKTSAQAIDADDFHAALAARGGRWYSACLRITQNTAMAEDALQEALIKAWHARTRFRGQAELDTWLHRIAVNCAIDQLRARRHFVELPDADLAQHTPEQDQVLLPDAVLAQSQQQQHLARAMKCLSTQERVCFELKHREQWRLEEIAQELDISLNATKQALFRAVRKLRAALPDLAGAP
jgi:RNA polymerase sigma-70 factor, ECF subfamily